VGDQAEAAGPDDTAGETERAGDGGAGAVGADHETGGERGRTARSANGEGSRARVDGDVGQLGRLADADAAGAGVVKECGVERFAREANGAARRGAIGVGDGGTGSVVLGEAHATWAGGVQGFDGGEDAKAGEDIGRGGAEVLGTGLGAGEAGAVEEVDVVARGGEEGGGGAAGRATTDDDDVSVHQPSP
jgi:hypothetical protein